MENEELEKALGEEAVPRAELKEQIVLEHLSFVRFILRRIAIRLPSHIDLEDLYNAGVIGLLDAIDKYEPGKNVKFKTYAEFRIKGAIFDQLRTYDWIPRSVRQKNRRLEKAFKEVEQRLGRKANDEEVADELGITLDQFYELKESSGISLIHLEDVRHRNDRGNSSFHEFVEDSRSRRPSHRLEIEELKRLVKNALKTLKPSERAVISFYFYSDLAEINIGAIIGITESRVCQIIEQALLKLERRCPNLESYLDE